MQSNNGSLILREDGFFWPKYDKVMEQYLKENDRLNEPFKISEYCKNKRTCIQAGGNVGVYPIAFSKYFEQVVTFEPELFNFECLDLNIKNQKIKNVQHYHAALGNEHRHISLQIDMNNCGGHNMGTQVKDGNIPMVKIDDFNLENVDLIALDVEGFEIQALAGGIETIKKYHPIICAEIVWSDCTEFLQNLGYNKLLMMDGNGIFEYGG